MIKDFVNNKQSEKQTDKMMEEFYKKNDEIEFKKKWRRIIEEELNSNNKNLFKRIKKFTSIAAIFLLLVFATTVIFKTDLQYPISYSLSIKGDKDKVKNLDKLIEQFLNSHSSILIKKDKNNLELLTRHYYRKIYNKSDDLREEGYKLSEETILITSFAAIEQRKFFKGLEYINMIEPTSQYFKEVSKMKDLLDKIVD